MYKLALVILFSLSSNLAVADYVGGSTISKLYGAKNMRFGVDNASTQNTCDYWGRQFIFDATSESGKNMFTIIIAANMAGKKVDIWFTPSLSPDTDQDSGCNGSTMAVVTSVGFTQ